jgi:hypothetical protein
MAMSSLSTSYILLTTELMGVNVCVGRQFNREASTNTLRLIHLDYIIVTARALPCKALGFPRVQVVVVPISLQLP